MSERSLIKLGALRIPTVLKRDSNKGFLLQNLQFNQVTLFYRLSSPAQDQFRVSRMQLY